MLNSNYIMFIGIYVCNNYENKIDKNILGCIISLNIKFEMFCVSIYRVFQLSEISNIRTYSFLHRWYYIMYNLNEL